ncbi:MAG: hypothetical protein DA328_04500 [Nitrososphaeraceae archaeon]|nr:hypothetical protein [Nitrososphaeraceae archaeon]
MENVVLKQDKVEQGKIKWIMKMAKPFIKKMHAHCHGSGMNILMVFDEDEIQLYSVREEEEPEFIDSMKV